ncbi:Cell division control protein, partial [Operophtera brumata]
MALTHVDTPLKGGLNTPLQQPDFSGALPASQAVATPNTVLATPFSINPEERLSAGDTPQLAHQMQKQTLPSPRNDYEIVVPEHEDEAEEGRARAALLEDQADRDARHDMEQDQILIRNDYEIVVPEHEDEAEEGRARAALLEDQANRDARHDMEQDQIRKMHACAFAGIAELKLRSQAVQRGCARPCEVNASVVRGAGGGSLTALQHAEELLKGEMVTMLHYDSLRDPPPGVDKKRAVQLQASHLAYLEQHPYEEFTSDELEAAKLELKKEMDVVKSGMGHGELSMDAYTQVLFLPGQNRYTRANLASKKDRLESAEKRLEQNRSHMAKEAKKCSKMEKKLRVLTGGYQSRAAALIKQFQELQDQIEQANLEFSTFKFLADQEKAAIPRRIE